MGNLEVRIVGNVVKPVNYFENKFAIVRVAVNIRKNTSEEAVIYYDVKLFPERFKDILYYDLQTGDRVIVTGSVSLYETTKDDKVYKDYSIYCTSIDKIWKRPKETNVNKSIESGALSGKF